MKGFAETLEHFSSFPKSEFDAQTVIDQCKGKAGEASVRRALDELCRMRLIKWRWVEGKTGAKKTYQLEMDETACLDVFKNEEKQPIIRGGAVSAL